MSDRELVVFWAGNAWDGLPATDHHLAKALAQYVDVCWVDPTVSVHHSRKFLPSIEQAAEGIDVLRVNTVPGASRSGLRQVAAATQRAALAWYTARGQRPWATISASPRVELPARGAGVTVLHVTDDWLAGAPMMGLDAAWLERVLRANVATADVVSAVSVDLAQVLQRMKPRHPVEVVPNGATIGQVMPELERERVAVLVGQLNERLDVDLMEAIIRAGVPLRILGPRSDREPEQGRRLDALLARPEVDWRGPVPHDEVVGLLAGSAVGITPYALNDFNQASFPLKTLEYLAIGLPVVSSPLDSLEWLGTDLVDVADSPERFGEMVRRRADQPRDAALEQRRRDFANRHSWQARAEALLSLVEARSTRR
ncbi:MULTISPECIES: glycosyltransferase family protein [unclassified Luteococcus]|uniref:glycosyltransferase family protein n=1 Tax=unclassified Luteococcus TaxID=2639923 RepID=UPI00313DE838